MLPSATTVPAVRLTTDTFRGLDCRPRPLDGACAAMQNLTGADHPVLSARPGRGAVTTLAHPGGLLAKDALCWVDAPYFCVDGYPIDLGLTPGAKQLVSMGAYAVIFPDKKYLNTKDFTDYGSLEARVTTAGTVAVTLCTRDGTALAYAAAAEAPAAPAEGDLWLDTAAPALYRFTTSGWSEEADVHVKLEYASLGVRFSAGDGVTVSGAGPLDGLRVLTDAGDNFLLLPGVTAAASLTEPVTISRDVPDLDFVTECGNRLWGCRYGIAGGETVNEILCCKLGDFKNWNAFAGLSTDSWRASRGADGPFTGAATYQGSPIFFRETCLERVYPDSGGAHQILVTQCAGVQRGCGASLAVAGGLLCYKSPDGVSAYDGAAPVRVSDRLGSCRFTDAVGGALGEDYYLSVRDGESRRLLVYNTMRGDWFEQDDPGLTAMALCSWELYGLTASGGVLAMTGTEGEGEEPVAWYLETGDLGLDIPEHKHISRLRLRCCLGGVMTVAVQYDSDGLWRSVGTVESLGLRSMTLPILPRRCDHLRLRLQGSGTFQLYSLSRILEKGSDEP